MMINCRKVWTLCLVLGFLLVAPIPATVIRMEQSHINRPDHKAHEDSPESSTAPMLTWVYCPGDKVMCPDHSTCCNITATQYGCCPQANAMCCADGIHCCSKGFKCSIVDHVTKCVAQETNGILLNQISGFNNPILISSSSQYVESHKDSNTEAEESHPQDSPDDNQSTATSDPSEHFEASEAPSGSLQGSSEQPLPMQPDQSAYGDNFGFMCPNHRQMCPTNSTCCKGKINNQYGCCLFPNAVCCSDYVHCCPSHHHCTFSKLKILHCVSNRWPHIKLSAWP